MDLGAYTWLPRFKVYMVAMCQPGLGSHLETREVSASFVVVGSR